MSIRHFRALCGAGLILAGIPWALPSSAWADGSCRTLEVRFQPQGFPKTDREPQSPQIAAWVEDKDGHYIDTLYVSRTTGLLGLGNRSGSPVLKSDFRWPYGKRPYVLPVWAHRRNHTYPMVVMGGKCSPNCGGDAHNGAANPDDENTVAYHGSVSSADPFFCSPSHRIEKQVDGVDVVSCASPFYSSKGHFDANRTSLYPPRADIDPTQLGALDSPDLARYAAMNDVAAVSGATFANGQVINPPVRWTVTGTLPDGDYVIRVEVNIENDFNLPWWAPGRSAHDEYSTWDAGFGGQYLGQPSVVYSVPVHLDAGNRGGLVADYEGYGDVTGDTGDLHPPDMTIATKNGSGADRLALVTDADGNWRVKVDLVSALPGVAPPPPAPSIDFSDITDSTIKVNLRLQDGSNGATLQVRYREALPITDQSFDVALPAPAPTAAAGGVLSTQLKGLLPKTTYYVAARAQAACGATSKLASASSITQLGQFTTLSGCFIATAAYGSPMMRQVGALRAFRDRTLLTTPIGKLLVASYYATSPPLAQLIDGPGPGDAALRSLARSALGPLVDVVTRIAP